NGYSGHTPRHYDLLATYLLRGDRSILWHYARGRALAVVRHREPEPDGELRALVKQAGGMLTEESGVGPVFLVPPQARVQTPGTGAALAPAPAPAGDGYAAVDLGGQHVVRAVTINLRWRYAEVGPRMTIESSIDGAAWAVVWDGWAGDAALTGALRDQRLVPMT